MPKLNRQPGAGRKPKPRAGLTDRGPLPPADPTTDTGLRAVIERLKAAEIAAQVDYAEARKTGDPGAIAYAKKDWLDLCEQLRKIEVSTPGVLSENQATMRVEDVVTEFVRMGTQFRIGLEALPRSLPPRLVGLDEAGIQEVMQAAVIEVLEQLATEKW